MPLSLPIRHVFHFEHDGRQSGAVRTLRDGTKLTVGTTYDYADFPEGTFPAEGKLYEFTGTGQHGPHALDAVTDVVRTSEDDPYVHVVHFLDGTICQVRVGAQTDIHCRCSDGDDICPHALGALYVAADACATNPCGPERTFRQLKDFMRRWRDTGGLIPLIAAADAGYAFACAGIERVHISRMGLPPLPDLPVEIRSLTDVLFA